MFISVLFCIFVEKWGYSSTARTMPLQGIDEVSITSTSTMIKVVNKYKHKPTPEDVYIGRGSVLGNPFTSIKDRETKAHVVCDSRGESVERYRQHINEAIATKLKPITDELNRIYKLAKTKDVNLVCYCSPKSCHGDIIKELIESKL